MKTHLDLFAARLRAHREELGLTVTELAASLGLSAGTVHRWEAGTATPPLPRLLALAELLGCHLSDLVDG